MREYLTWRLGNGLKVILVPKKEVKSVTAVLGVRAGSRDEASEKSGLSHFLEHMALKGTKKRPTPFEVAAVIDGVGGEQNAQTSKETTEYWAKVASVHLERALDLLADNILAPIFEPRQLERERLVILEELNMYEDMPARRVGDIFETLVYGKTDLGREIGGVKKTVAKIKREDLKQFMQYFYLAPEMVLVLAGDFEEEKAKSLIEKYFAFLPTGKGRGRKKFVWGQKKSGVSLVYKKTDQAHFCLGVPGVAFSSSDRYAVSVLAAILGYSRTSRLYRRIREERGLAYYVQAAPDFYSDAGSFCAQAGVSLGKIDEAISLVVEEFDRLVRELVGKVELRRAKDYLKGRTILALEDSQQVASRYVTQWLVGGELRSVEESLRQVEAVTAVKLQAVARRLFGKRNFYLALIGPFKEKERFRKLL